MRFVHHRLALSFCTACEAKTMLHAHLKRHHFITVAASFNEGGVIVLKRIDEICKFTLFLQRVHRTYPTKTIVVCVGQDCAASLTMAALLLGGFMILGSGMNVEG